MKYIHHVIHVLCVYLLLYANTKEDASNIGFRDDFIYEYLNKLANGINDNNILNLKSMNREEAIKVFKRYSEDKDKIVY